MAAGGGDEKKVLVGFGQVVCRLQAVTAVRYGKQGTEIGGV